MAAYVSILRGINAGGHRKIKMDALRRLCEGIGLANVRTYIQSGNVVFTSVETDAAKLSSEIGAAVEKAFRFEAPVITLAGHELEKIIKSNPFAKDAKKEDSFLHVTFLSACPGKERLEAVGRNGFGGDEYEIGEKAVYLYCPDGYGRTKLTNGFWESKLETAATTRNWKTVNELYDMIVETDAV